MLCSVPNDGYNWDVTWLGNQAGWLEGSAFPIWVGNTAITGHVWDSNNNPGPFANLKYLQYGDLFYIHANGHVYTYEVRETSRVYPANMNAIEHSDYDTVTRIPFEFWSPWTNQYSFRRTVEAVLIDVN